MIEYGLLIAGIALIAAVSVSIFGNKTADLIAAVATVIPGSSGDDNLPIINGHLIETTLASNLGGTSMYGYGYSGMVLDVSAIAGRSSGYISRLNAQLAGTPSTSQGFPVLVLQATSVFE